VKSRVSRFKYGIEASVRYNPYDPQHAERSSQAIFMVDGVKRLPGEFSTILDEVGFTGSPILILFLQYHRVSAFLKRKSFGRPIATSRDRERVSTVSAILSKLTRGAPRIHVGLTLNLVVNLVVDCRSST
jgi:hypothetical protein